MASMTRLDMVNELKAHGWNRFVDSALQRYLDWALQTTYAEGSFDRSVPTKATVSSTSLDQIPFTTISGGSSELVQKIERVYVKSSGGVPFRMGYASDDYFETYVRPNMEATQPVRAFPSVYAVYDSNVVLYPKPSEAVDVIVDYLLRKDAFADDSAVTGLPERFDKIVLSWAESYCHGRAREFNEQVNRERMARDMMLRELSQEHFVSQERTGRVSPWVA